jgi:hypothetical protein
MGEAFKGIFARVGDRRCGTPAAVLGASILCLVLLAPSALANSHGFTTTFGTAATSPANPYPLSDPTDVAVDLASHDVYVTDTGNHRIEKFDSAGHLLLMFGRRVNRTAVLAKAPQEQQDVCDPSLDECQSGAASATSPPGSLNTPTFIDVDNSSGPSAGDIYVADTYGSIVSKFDSGGLLITSWNTAGQLVRNEGINGIAVGPTGRLSVMTTIYPFKLGTYDQSGVPVNEFHIPSNLGTVPVGIAVDGRERFYKSGNSEFPTVQEYTEQEIVNNSAAPGPITGMAVDPMSNDLYTAEQGGTSIARYRSQCEGCPPLETFGAGKLSQASGFSVDAPSDNVYVANTGEDSVAVFNGMGPYATTEPPVSIGRTTATIAGHIADGGRGAITGCQFEYGTGESYELGTVPCAPAGPYGSEADVTAALSGLQPETTYHYRLVSSNASASAEGADLTFTPHYVIQAHTEPAVNLGNHSAELTGAFIGDGHDTKYHFEYGTTEAYGKSTPELDAGEASGLQEVSSDPVVGLQAGTTYHFRIVATNSLGTTVGQDVTFMTFDRPLIGSVFSRTPTATSAELFAQINPQGADTTYQFEYGTTPSYGTSAPIPAGDIGAAPGSQKVSLELSGLQVGVTYHFRVVAENEFGTVTSEDQDFGFYPPDCPNGILRQETGSNHLPDCRAYELVSPGNAGGTLLYPEGPTTPNAINPSRFAFGGMLDTIPGTGDPTNVKGDLYVSTRTTSGWVTKYVGIPATETNIVNGPPFEPNVQQNFFLAAPAGVRTNTDMSEFIDWNGANITFVNETPPPGPFLEPRVWAADGSSLGEWPTVPGYDAGPILNQSADFSHYYFISGGTLYETYYEGGSAYDNNTVADTISPIGFDASDAPISVQGVPGSSTDGSRILMSTSPCTVPVASECAPGELYMRVDDSLTYDIAKGHTLQYVGMTADASKVYFTSPDQLTPADKDTSVDLYMWSESTDSLTLVSAGTGGTAGNSDSCSASWTTQCGVVPFVNNFFSVTFAKGAIFGDGKSDNAIAANAGDIYFYSPELLDGEKGIANAENVYVFRHGSVKYVTTLTTGPYCEREPYYSGECSAGPIVRMQVTPDGDHMAFLTATTLDGAENAGHTEMYRYDPESGAVTCVSCGVSGTPATSDVWASANGSFLTNDGRTFFSTADALVPRDSDGVRDVYEYVEGRPQLISSGTSGKASQRSILGINNGLFVAQLDGVSSDGTDAYFSTYDTLVPQDRNGGFLKFYDARVNGGFAFDTPPAPCEAADECVGHGSSPASIPPLTSGVPLGGGGNVTRRSHRHKARKKRHKHSKKSGQHRGRQGRRNHG